MLYPIVMIFRMARLLYAQIATYFKTGTVPIFNKICTEVITWIRFLLPIIGMIIFGSIAWLLLPFAYIMAPFFMDSTKETRRTKRMNRKTKINNKIPMKCFDARKMSVSNYMVHPSWSFIFCEFTKWWKNFFQALKVVKNFILIPMRWSSKWAILWPPPGILLSAITVAFIIMVHGVIFLRLFLLCVKYRSIESFKRASTHTRKLIKMFLEIYQMRGSINLKAKVHYSVLVSRL